MEQVAEITLKIRIFKGLSNYGYEIAMGTAVVSGWATSEGLPLQTELHAWRTALKRCKNQSMRAPGLLSNMG